MAGGHETRREKGGRLTTLAKKQAQVARGMRFILLCSIPSPVLPNVAPVPFALVIVSVPANSHGLPFMAPGCAYVCDLAKCSMLASAVSSQCNELFLVQL